MGTAGGLRNWAGNVTFGASRVHRPASVAELGRIVAAAERIRAVGSGHSFNLVADTDGELVRLDGLPHRFELAADRRSVTVAAGMKYAEVAAPLQAAGFALANLASLPHISVAGAVATGTHGSGSTQRSLSAAVSGLELVGPDGEPRALSRASEPAELAGAVVALGAYGIVTAVTLDIEPTFDVAQYVFTGLPLDRLIDEFDGVTSSAYSVSVFTDWHGGEGIAWLKRRTDREPSGPPSRDWRGAALSDRAHHPVPGMPPEYCTVQSGAAGPWHERLPHFRPEFTPSRGEELQSELLLPRAAAPEACAVLRRLGHRIAPVLQISEVRTVAADDLWLSPFHGRDSVAFHFTWLQDADAVLPVIAAMERELLPLGARPHWGKLTTVPPADLAGLYERAGDFRKLLLGLDPRGKFRNAFVDGVLGPV